MINKQGKKQINEFKKQLKKSKEGKGRKTRKDCVVKKRVK